MTATQTTTSRRQARRAALRRAAFGLLAHLRECVPDTDRKGDPGALAALRRSLGKTPAEAIEACRVVERHVPDIPLSDQEHEAFYLVGGLFALHPYDQPIEGRRDQSCLGASLRAIRWRDDARQEEDDGVSRRFIAALEATRDALPTHLRYLVTLFASRSEHPIDYLQLFEDLLDWEDSDRSVQRAWAAGFWRAFPTRQAGAEDDTSGDDETTTSDDTADN